MSTSYKVYPVRKHHSSKRGIVYNSLIKGTVRNLTLSKGVYFADKRVEKKFYKILEKLPRDFQQIVYAKLKELGTNPYPQGKKIKPVKSELILYGYTAEYRLRIGDYRVLYDVDEKNKKVVLLALRKKGKETYK